MAQREYIVNDEILEEFQDANIQFAVSCELRGMEEKLDANSYTPKTKEYENKLFAISQVHNLNKTNSKKVISIAKTIFDLTYTEKI
jgi:hypothetical protein